MGIIRQLTEKRRFSDTETRIANYILEHPEEISGLSIGELAEYSFSSNAAVIRLCRKVGVSGYKEFRISYAAELEKQRYEKHNINMDAPFEPGESTSDIMRSIVSISKEALDSCYASISTKAIEETARLLRDADHIYIFAVGDTYINALTFSNMLIKIGYHSVMANQFNESVAIAAGATERDAALFVSYSGRMIRAMAKELKALRRNGCRCILLSSLAKCEGFKYLISFPHKEQSVGRVTGYYSQTCIKFVLDSLYGVIYTLDLEKNRKAKTQADELARS